MDRNNLLSICDQTLQVLNSFESLATSPQVISKIQDGKNEINKYVTEIKKTELSLMRLHEIANRITAMGHDLINYGLMIVPKNNNN